MKLAEALQERADINKKISELKRRLERDGPVGKTDGVHQ